MFEILLKVSEGKSWKDTLLEVLPQRKFKMPNNPNQKKHTNIDAESKKDEDVNEDKLADGTEQLEIPSKSDECSAISEILE